MAVSHGEGGSDAEKATLDSLEIIRLLLDHATEVDEALALFDDYNIDWGSGPPVHYLIADASGDSAVVELIDGSAVVTRSLYPGRFRPISCLPRRRWSEQMRPAGAMQQPEHH